MASDFFGGRGFADFSTEQQTDFSSGPFSSFLESFTMIMRLFSGFDNLALFTPTPHKGN